MANKDGLILFLRTNGKTKSWAELAQMFGYGSCDTARKAWSIYQKEEGENFVVKKETRDRHDVVTHRTLKNEPIQPELKTDGLRLKKAWVTPEGRVGRTYEKDDLYGIPPEDIPILFEKINKQIKITTTAPQHSSVGVVVVSDIHAGAVVKALDETIYKRDFNEKILSGYLSEISGEVNKFAFSEVHLIIPGDIVESFTAFNHADTWKHVEKHQGGLIIAIHEILRQFFESIDNLASVYMIEGNHDRMTQKKEGNSRKGLVEVTSYFLQKTSNINIVYHPWMIRQEIDGIFYIVTHGDWKPLHGGYDSFLFQYGMQKRYNAFITGHFHSFKVVGHGRNYMHIQAPSVYTGSFFEEAQGYNAGPGYLICQRSKEKLSISLRPL